MINTIEKLGVFNVWANETLLARLDESVAAGHELPASARRLFSHVLNAQAIWIARIGGTVSPVKVWQEHDLAGLHHWHEQTSGRLRDMMAGADDAELHRRIHYTNSLGDAYDSAVADILTHAVVHASYHRGQAAARLREAGLKPVNTDFITYCRQQDAAGFPNL